MLEYTTILGLVAACLTTFSFLPQVIKVVKTKHTKDLSLLMYSIISVGIILWLVYGLIIMDIPLIFANAISLVFTATILVYKLKYK